MPGYKRRTYTRKLPTSTKRKRTRKLYRSKKKSRYYSKKKHAYTLSNNISLGMKRHVRLCYHSQFLLSPTGVTHGARTYQLNSIYDPDVTGIGHQPFGHDTYQSLYKKYLVKGAKITATFVHEMGGTGQPVWCSVFLDKNGTLDSNLDTKMEQVHGRGVKPLLSNSREKAVCTQFYSPKTFFDVKDAEDEHQMAAQMGGQPNLPAYAVVWAQCMDHAGSGPNLTVSVKIEYFVELSDPIPLTQS